MNTNFNSLKLVGKVAYLIGMLLLFNFFFGLLFFRFIYWILFGAVLLFLLSGILALGKKFLFTAFTGDKQAQPSTHNHEDVIDVEAEVFESNDKQD